MPDYKEECEKLDLLDEKVKYAMDLLDITINGEPAFHIDWIKENILKMDVDKPANKG